MFHLPKAVSSATGKKFKKFCVEDLKSNYAAFQYRRKNAKLTIDEIFYMLARTGLTFEELFQPDYADYIKRLSALIKKGESFEMIAPPPPKKKVKAAPPKQRHRFIDTFSDASA